MPLLLEYWKPVVGWEGHYEISNVGNVRRIKKANGAKAQRILRPAINQGGYYHAVLYGNGRHEDVRVHQLVCEAFIGTYPEGLTANHKNGWKLKNWHSNFEYITLANNIRHSFTFSDSRRGEKHCCAKLKEVDVLYILSMKGKKSPKSLANQFNTGVNSIYDIYKGRRWKHLSNRKNVILA